MEGQVSNREAHLASIRLGLVLARLCKQKWQIYQDCWKAKTDFPAYREALYKPLVDSYKLSAASHRRFVKAALELIENQRGATYMAGYTPPPAATFSESHFSEWPEYKEVYAKNYDTWR